MTICIITFLFGKAFITPITNLQEVFSSFSEKIYVVTGGAENPITKTSQKTRTFRVSYNAERRNILFRLAKYIQMQIRISLIVARFSKDISLCIFFMEDSPGLPMLTAKLLRKRIIWILPSAIQGTNRNAFSWLLAGLKNASLRLSDRIVIYSSSLIEEWGLNKTRNKVLTAHEHILDFNRFKIENRITERKRLIGFMGRFASEKGIINFVEAIPKILEKRSDLGFLIVGDGHLRNRLEAYLNRKKLWRKVTLMRWISHDQVASYLNRLRILVVPSYTEGLPNIVLEAMACGTPVLSTSVGVIPDIIKDGETGFLLKSNDPKHIADKIVELFNEQQLLEEVSQNAYKWVRENFSKEETIRIWQRILSQLGIS